MPAGISPSLPQVIHRVPDAKAEGATPNSDSLKARQERGASSGVEANDILEGVLKRHDHRVVEDLVIHAHVGTEFARLLAVEGHQLDETLRLADGLSIVRDRLLGLCNGDDLPFPLMDIRVDPPRDRGLVVLKGIFANGKPGVEEHLVVAAGRVEVRDHAEQLGAIEVGELRLDVTPRRFAFGLAGRWHGRSPTLASGLS